METISYQLTTRSSLIVSPRSDLAFYADLEQFSSDKIEADSDYLKKERLKVIYPFYQYGSYETYNPNDAVYYLPGSSIKGALNPETAVARNVMVDDILISNNHMVLRNIYKVQYLDDTEKASFDVFFDHVGVEMVKVDVTLEGEFRVSDCRLMEKILEDANKSARIRMGQMKEYLSWLVDREYNKDKLRETLQEAIHNLSPLLEQKNIFLLGGYKGLLHAMLPTDLDQVIESMGSAVYLDKQTMLPYGLVTIELK